MILLLAKEKIFCLSLGYVIGNKVPEGHFWQKNSRKYRTKCNTQPLVRKWIRGSLLCKFLGMGTPNFESWILETVKDKFQK